MIEKLQQTMREEISKLPRENQEAIYSVDWLNISEKIAKKYILTEQETIDFQTETGIVLLGLSDFWTYSANIEDIGISKSKSEEMSKEVFQEIFKPIADKIETSIKNRIRIEKIKWDQTINFIISGGDYSNFIEK